VRRTALTALALILLLAGCVTAPAPVAPEAGGLVRARLIGYYPAVVLRAALRLAGLPGPTPIRCGVRAWRVVYWTSVEGGEPELASGLYAEPTFCTPRAVVSYQHGSVSRRDDVPSRGNVEGIAAAAVFAGGGYTTLAADYPGMGDSEGVHGYLHAASTAAAARDLLRAGRALAAQRGSPWAEGLLLVGFSQGGHATTALQRSLEREPPPGQRLVGAAAGSAPFDLENVAFPFALAGSSRDHAAYLAYLCHAYAERYEVPLESVLRAPWDERARALLEGGYDEDDLPRDPRALFTADFLAAHDAGERTWLHRALGDNETVAWAPRAPLRVYVGRADETVTPRDAELAVAEMQRRGGRVELLDVGPLDHRDAALAAVPLIRRWFDDLLAAGTPASP
jgi:pimeloyl-ACP methyl ester carboxylesterase